MNRVNADDDAKWLRSAVFYMLPIRSFCDGDGDGIGDFRGLTERLTYIHDLGATCLWLLPFFTSPWRDEGYDVADYHGIDPSLGTFADFERFLAAAHRRGLRVMAEIPVNHTSIDHPWFRAARVSPQGSAPRDFYVWREDAPQEADGASDARSHWTWSDEAGAYYFHRFAAHQPDLNYDNPLVADEMAGILRFWAARGLDGLCLNGASVLFEGNDSLDGRRPETRTLLRRFREEVRAERPGCVVQAGLNAAPAEAARYFDDAQCDLVPHVPLAQSLFLSLAHGGARPLNEMLRRTPPAPAGRNWVLLLRNHDELQIDGTDDEDRDVLLRRFASDGAPSVREGGIARRLAPLVGNGRGRLELLHQLLLALPGAPLIYYGDEIGMGDDARLPGRAAVRTPMQWSADHNAGFSTAEAASLHLPIVADAVYGHAAVNVERQLRDPDSLLKRLRSLLALRADSPALTQGDLELVECSNRHVCSFLRRTASEQILVAANFAPTLQAVELNLDRYDRYRPVEATGGSTLPPIADGRLFLTMPPHSCFWLRLRGAEEAELRQRAPVPLEEIREIPRLVVDEDEADGRWTSSLLRRLETEVLPRHLASQRWFGGKSRAIRRVRVRDHGKPAGTELDACWILLEVEFAEGNADLYVLPLVVCRDHAARQILEESRSGVVAVLESSNQRRRPALLLDALAAADFRRGLLDAFAQQSDWPLDGGRIRARPTAAFEELYTGQSISSRRGPATSSNSLVFYGRRWLLKLFRKTESGINPDFEIGRYLTEAAGFRRTPREGGVLEYEPTGGEPVTLGLLQELVPNQGDGWEHALAEIGRYLSRAHERGFDAHDVALDGRSLVQMSESSFPGPLIIECFGPYYEAALTLGRRTAELHLALARSTEDAAFAPEPFTRRDLAELADRVVRQAEHARGALERSENLADDVRAEITRLVQVDLEPLRREIASGDCPAVLVKTRCHGDYHLGQVLCVDDDYFIIDFEGEPARSLAERRQKGSPLRDVAGMLRSYHYAAYAGLFAFYRRRPELRGRLDDWCELWHRWSSALFLRAYRDAAAGAAFVPQASSAFERLLDAFLLEKAFYELAYELNNRPDWVRIPLQGISALLSARAAATT